MALARIVRVMGVGSSLPHYGGRQFSASLVRWAWGSSDSARFARRYSSQRFGGVAPDGERGSAAKLRRFFASPAAQPAPPPSASKAHHGAVARAAGAAPLHCVFV